MDPCLIRLGIAQYTLSLMTTQTSWPPTHADSTIPSDSVAHHPVGHNSRSALHCEQASTPRRDRADARDDCQRTGIHAAVYTMIHKIVGRTRDVGAPTAPTCEGGACGRGGQHSGRYDDNQHFPPRFLWTPPTRSYRYPLCRLRKRPILHPSPHCSFPCIDINAADYIAQAAVVIAARQGYMECLDILVGACAALRSVGVRALSPLHCTSPYRGDRGLFAIPACRRGAGGSDGWSGTDGSLLREAKRALRRCWSPVRMSQ